MAFHSSNAACTALAPSLPDASPVVMHVATFLVFFILYALVFTLIGKLLEKILKLVMLGWLNRLLGLVLAIANGLLVLFTALNNTFEIVEQKTLAESVLYQPLYNFGSALFPYLKALIFTE